MSKTREKIVTEIGGLTDILDAEAELEGGIGFHGANPRSLAVDVDDAHQWIVCHQDGVLVQRRYVHHFQRVPMRQHRRHPWTRRRWENPSRKTWWKPVRWSDCIRKPRVSWSSKIEHKNGENCRENEIKWGNPTQKSKNIRCTHLVHKWRAPQEIDLVWSS